MSEEYARFASALYSIALDENRVDLYKEAFALIDDEFYKNAAIVHYFDSYFVENEEKFAFIDKLTKDLKLPYFTSFLKVLIVSHVIYHVHAIYLEFKALANESLGIKEGIIYSAYPLTKENIVRIEKAFLDKQGKKVEFKNEVDETILGGLKVVLDGKIYDDSIRGKLTSLKETLLERKA